MFFPLLFRIAHQICSDLKERSISIHHFSRKCYSLLFVQLLGVKRDYKVMEDGDFDEDEPSISKNSKTVKDSNKSHTRRCREKVNDKFKQLLEELPLPPTGIEVQHKAQILDYTIKTLKDLSNQKTSLETELAFSSKKNLLRWVDHVISNSRTLSDAVRPFLDMFCTKKGWKYAELWLPSTQKGDGTGDPNHEVSVQHSC